MRRDEEPDEVVVVLVDVPTEDAWQHDAVSEARDGEQLGEPLEEAENDRLEV
jgi:hypothetical protein